MSGGRGGGGRGNTLGFKLVGQDQVCKRHQQLVSRNHVLSNVEPAIIPHDRIENPEEPPRSILKLVFELTGDAAHCPDGLGTGNIPGEHHVKVIQVGQP